MGRDGVHQHAAGVGRLAARHVDADAVQRRDFLAQQGAFLVAVGGGFAALGLLPVVVAANAGGGLGERLALGGGQAVEGGLQLGGAELQRGHRCGLQAVEPGGVVEHRGVATRAHVGQDVPDALLDGLVLLGAPVQALLEFLLEIGIQRGQAGGSSY